MISALAIHEVGHSVAATAFGYKVARLTIRPVYGDAKFGDAAGHATYEGPSGGLDEAIIALAGQEAEARYYGNACGRRDDRRDVREARAVVLALLDGNEAEVDAVLGDLRERAALILEERWALVISMAVALDWDRELDGAQLCHFQETHNLLYRTVQPPRLVTKERKKTA